MKKVFLKVMHPQIVRFSYFHCCLKYVFKYCINSFLPVSVPISCLLLQIIFDICLRICDFNWTRCPQNTKFLINFLMFFVLLKSFQYKIRTFLIMPMCKEAESPSKHIPLISPAPTPQRRGKICFCVDHPTPNYTLI